jgi:hypothetical protein
MNAFPDTMPLGEARILLRLLVEDGYACPLCTQFAKVYRRKIHSAMAVDAIRCWRAVEGLEWFDLTRIVGKRGTGDVTKLRYWGLMVQQEGERDDGSNRVGIWRFTPLGAEWVLARRALPKYARIYDSRCLGLDGDQVTILDALGDGFDYGELMRGE